MTNPTPPRQHHPEDDMENETRLLVYDALMSACENVRFFCNQPCRGTGGIDEAESDFKDIIYIMRTYAAKWKL